MKSNFDFSMKLCFLFLAILVGGTLLGALLYSVYTICTTLVAGQGFETYHPMIFMQGCLISFPVVFPLSALFMCFYLIRHKTKYWSPVIAYSIVFVLVWVFFLPVVVNAYASSMINIPGHSSRPISAGFFRSSDDYVFYYSNVSIGNVADGVCITNDPEEKNVFTFENIKLHASTNGFSDSLVEDAVVVPIGIEILYTGAALFLELIVANTNSGVINWLVFSSLALAIVSIMYIRKLSMWRLVNAVMILFLTSFIISLNIAVSYGFILQSASDKVNSIMGFIPGRANKLLFIVNIVWFGSMVFAGIMFHNREIISDDEDLYGDEV